MKKFIQLALAICATSCAQNIQSQNRALCDCDIIYGRASDWDNISDDLVRNIYRNNLKCEKLLN